MSQGTWPAALKAALNAMGLPAGVPRDPICPLGPIEIARLNALLLELKVIA